MRVLQVLLIVLLLSSCATAEVAEVQPIETYVFGVQEKENEKEQKKEEPALQKDTPVLEKTLENITVTSLQEPYNEETEQHKTEPQKKDEEEIIIVEEEEKPVVQEQKEEIIEVTDIQSTEEEAFIEDLTASQTYEKKREIVHDLSVIRKIYIFFKNNMLYCVGLASMVVFSVVLFIVVCTRPSYFKSRRKPVKTPRLAKKKITTSQNKNSRQFESDQNQINDSSDIREDDFLIKLLGK